MEDTIPVNIARSMGYRTSQGIAGCKFAVDSGGHPEQFSTVDYAAADYAATAVSAMIGASPSIVVRCISLVYRFSSNPVAQCWVQRLSHRIASPSRQRWR